MRAKEANDEACILESKQSAARDGSQRIRPTTGCKEHRGIKEVLQAATAMTDGWIYLRAVIVEAAGRTELTASSILTTSLLDPKTGNEHALRCCLRGNQAAEAYNEIVGATLRNGYSGTLLEFNFHISAFHKTIAEFLKDCPPNPDHLPREPAKWPGLRHADLVPFLEVNYGRYIGQGLTMEHIKKKDLELYRTIYYYRKHHKLPFDIPARPQLLDEKLDKFWLAGKAALTPKERSAVTKKLERSQGKNLR